MSGVVIHRLAPDYQHIDDLARDLGAVEQFLGALIQQPGSGWLEGRQGTNLLVQEGFLVTGGIDTNDIDLVPFEAAFFQTPREQVGHGRVHKGQYPGGNPWSMRGLFTIRPAQADATARPVVRACMEGNAGAVR